MITFHQPICWVIFGPRIPKYFNNLNVGVSMVRHVIFFTVVPYGYVKQHLHGGLVGCFTLILGSSRPKTVGKNIC